MSGPADGGRGIATSPTYTRLSGRPCARL